MKYLIKQVIVTEPKVELPEGSKAVGVQHHDSYDFIDSPLGVKVQVSEAWQVIYLEPEEA